MALSDSRAADKDCAGRSWLVVLGDGDFVGDTLGANQDEVPVDLVFQDLPFLEF
jgi:hypothetical protein